VKRSHLRPAVSLLRSEPFQVFGIIWKALFPLPLRLHSKIVVCMTMIERGSGSGRMSTRSEDGSLSVNAGGRRAERSFQPARTFLLGVPLRRASKSLEPLAAGRRWLDNITRSRAYTFVSHHTNISCSYRKTPMCAGACLRSTYVCQPVSEIAIKCMHACKRKTRTQNHNSCVLCHAGNEFGRTGYM